MYRYACYVLRYMADPEEARDAFYAMDRARCQPPLPPAEAHRTFESALGWWETEKLKSSPPPPEDPQPDSPPEPDPPSPEPREAPTVAPAAAERPWEHIRLPPTRRKT